SVIPQHAFIGHMVQVQACTVHQGHTTDLTGWLVSSCPAITEPPNPPKPPLLRPKILSILLVPRSVESISRHNLHRTGISANASGTGRPAAGPSGSSSSGRSLAVEM